ncbi:hypothetical protein TeGR_g5641 [Tetraparma gracilis]|nr:hypothetical protein TeGR_g5641 [Tetraparma gracilis]
MLRNPLVLHALIGAAGSDIDEVSNPAIICLSNLSIQSENHALMRDGVRIMNAIMARVDHAPSKKALLRICCIGDLPNTVPSLDLSLFCSRPFHHHLSLVKALIREFPGALVAKPHYFTRTPLKIAAQNGIEEILPLLTTCTLAQTAGHSLTHLVGYGPRGSAQETTALEQRCTFMLCLKRAADDERGLAADDPVFAEYQAPWVGDNDARAAMAGGQGRSHGVLDAGMLVLFFNNGARDPIAELVLRFAF